MRAAWLMLLAVAMARPSQAARKPKASGAPRLVLATVPLGSPAPVLRPEAWPALQGALSARAWREASAHGRPNRPWPMQLRADLARLAAGPLGTSLRHTKVEVWVQRGPAGEFAPDVEMLWRMRALGPGAASGPWRLQVQAQRLQAPQEVHVRAGVSRRFGTVRLIGALAAIDAELPPLLVPRLVQTKRLKRSGFLAGIRLGRLRATGLRPLLAQGEVPGFAWQLGAAGQLWLRRMQVPHLDGRLEAAVVWPLALAGRHRPAPALAWGRVATRAVANAGMDRPLVRVGGFRPRVGSGRTAPVHLLHEAILGHEDLAAYSARIALGEAGVLVRAGRHGRLGAFVSAGQVAPPGSGQRGGAVQAAGAVAHVALPCWGLPLSLSYQVACRRGTLQGTWLHLLTAGA